MKQCTSCGQILAQRIKTCPACGSAQVAGMTAIDDYKIQAIIHEGKSSLVFRALKKGGKAPVTIRLFTDQSGVDSAVAQRLEKELDTLAKLPKDLFVQHYAIRRSRQGFWYRISEWVDADNWGNIFLSGLLNDQHRIVTLFYNIALALDRLHAQDHFMPYLILDDILLPRNRTADLSVKINYKLSRFLNPRATHHGPMLEKLLDCHPDILNERAIDFKTGIWSLGKIFVELITADHNLTRFSSRVEKIKDTYHLVTDYPDSIGRMMTFYGHFGVLVRAYAYILTMGGQGLCDASKLAVLNANYVKECLKDTLNLPYDQPCMHECVFTDKNVQEHHISTMDMAKRLLDYGFHPPTVYFPLVVDAAFMVEPTETESKEYIDQFIDAVKAIVNEAEKNPDYHVSGKRILRRKKSGRDC